MKRTHTLIAGAIMLLGMSFTSGAIAAECKTVTNWNAGVWLEAISPGIIDSVIYNGVHGGHFEANCLNVTFSERAQKPSESAAGLANGKFDSWVDSTGVSFAFGKSSVLKKPAIIGATSKTVAYILAGSGNVKITDLPGKTVGIKRCGWAGDITLPPKRNADKPASFPVESAIVYPIRKAIADGTLPKETRLLCIDSEEAGKGLKIRSTDIVLTKLGGNSGVRKKQMCAGKVFATALPVEHMGSKCTNDTRVGAIVPLSGMPKMPQNLIVVEGERLKDPAFKAAATAFVAAMQASAAQLINDKAYAEAFMAKLPVLYPKSRAAKAFAKPKVGNWAAKMGREHIWTSDCPSAEDSRFRTFERVMGYPGGFPVENIYQFLCK